MKKKGGGENLVKFWLWNFEITKRRTEAVLYFLTFQGKGKNTYMKRVRITYSGTFHHTMIRGNGEEFKVPGPLNNIPTFPCTVPITPLVYARNRLALWQ